MADSSSNDLTVDIKSPLPDWVMKSSADLLDFGKAAGQSLLDLATTPGKVWQGQFDVRDLPQVGREYAANMAGWGLGAANVVGGGLRMQPGVPRMFGGIEAKTADLDQLAVARRLETSTEHDGTPVSPEHIWKETGWMRGPDNQWRFEIPDTGAKWKAGTRRQTGDSAIQFDPTWTSSKLGDLLDHPELFKAYPDLAEMPLSAVPRQLAAAGYAGGYTPGAGIMLAPGEAGNALSSGLHEVQHAIQEKEGFARGGTPEQFLPANFNDQLALIKDLHSITENHLRNVGIDPDDLVRAARRARQGKELLPEDLAVQEQAQKYPALVTDFGKSHAMISQMNQDLNQAYGKYGNLAGEVEARNVQERHDSGDYESSPWQTPGYTPWPQIVQFHDPALGPADVPAGTELTPVDHDPFEGAK